MSVYTTFVLYLVLGKSSSQAQPKSTVNKTKCQIIQLKTQINRNNVNK